MKTIHRLEIVVAESDYDCTTGLLAPEARLTGGQALLFPAKRRFQGQQAGGTKSNFCSILSVCLHKIRQEKTHEIPCVYGENIIFCKNAQ